MYVSIYVYVCIALKVFESSKWLVLWGVIEEVVKYIVSVI